MKMETQFKLTWAVSAAVSMFIIAPLAYMVADTQPPYEYDAEMSYIIPAKTQKGHQVTVHWKFSKVNRYCPGWVTRSVVDQQTGARVTYDPRPVSSKSNVDNDGLDRTFFLPQGITPGLKWYYADAEFACNPLQHIYPLRVRTPRLSFEVLE